MFVADVMTWYDPDNDNLALCYPSQPVCIFDTEHALLLPSGNNITNSSAEITIKCVTKLVIVLNRQAGQRIK